MSELNSAINWAVTEAFKISKDENKHRIMCWLKLLDQVWPCLPAFLFLKFTILQVHMLVSNYKADQVSEPHAGLCGFCP
jgi:hypothetical protein